jgi:hypothetical protein
MESLQFKQNIDMSTLYNNNIPEERIVISPENARSVKD